jgi:hypothetical protein
MKKIALTILLFVSLCSLSHAQQATVTKPITTPGSHLVKARNNFLLGTGFQAMGGLLLVGAGDPEQGAEAAYVLFGVGFLFQVNAWVQVGKAGKEMNRQRIGFALTGNGAAVRFTF